MKRFLTTFFIITLVFPVTRPSSAQDEDLRFHTIRAKGNVMAYHNENDETSRLYPSQSVDDGDKVITGADSEAVLRIKKKLYVYLAPKTKVNILKLRQGDKGFQCQVNLVTGRMLCQLDQAPDWSFEISAGSVLCHEHGTLFEMVRNVDALKIVSYEGAVVANFHGKTKMAKANEILELNHGKFRFKSHHFKAEEQGHLQNWQALLAEIAGKPAQTGP